MSDDKRSGDDRQSQTSSSHSTGRIALADLPEQYGKLIRHVSSLSNFPKKRKVVQPPPSGKMPLQPTSADGDSENTIEKETKALLQKVDTLVSVMEKMSIGPISIDNYRYEVIKKELQELSKMATKKEMSLEPLTQFQINNFNQKLQAVEFEIRDIYTSWIEYYSATLHEVFQQCLSLYKRITMLKKKSKKQKLFLHNITEFSSYAAAQKSSLYKLIHASYQPLPALNTIDEIHERISNLETMLNTPLPISFGNVPKPTVDESENKKKKEKTDKKKKQEMKSEKSQNRKSKDKAKVKFEEPEARKQHKHHEAKASKGPPMKERGESSIGKKK